MNSDRHYIHGDVDEQQLFGEARYYCSLCTMWCPEEHFKDRYHSGRSMQRQYASEICRLRDDEAVGIEVNRPDVISKVQAPWAMRERMGIKPEKRRRRGRQRSRPPKAIALNNRGAEAGILTPKSTGIPLLASPLPVGHARTAGPASAQAAPVRTLVVPPTRAPLSGIASCWPAAGAPFAAGYGPAAGSEEATASVVCPPGASGDERRAGRGG